MYTDVLRVACAPASWPSAPPATGPAAMPLQAQPPEAEGSTRRDGIACLISIRIRLLSPSDRLSCDAAGTSRTMLGNKSGTLGR